MTIELQTISRDGVIRAWATQYRDNFRVLGNGQTAAEIQEALEGLPEDASTEAINQVIGNESWTMLYCDGCGRNARQALKLQDYDNCFLLCKICTLKAAALFDKGKDPQEPPP